MKQIIVLKINVDGIYEELKFYENDLFSFKRMMSDFETKVQKDFGESLSDYGYWRMEFDTYSDLLREGTLCYTNDDNLDCWVTLEEIKSGVKEVEV